MATVWTHCELRCAPCPVTWQLGPSLELALGMASPANCVPSKCRGGTGRQIAAPDAIGVQGPSDTSNRRASGLFRVAQPTLLPLRTGSTWPVHCSLLLLKPARFRGCVKTYTKVCVSRQRSTKHSVLIIIFMWPVAGGRDAEGHGWGQVVGWFVSGPASSAPGGAGGPMMVGKNANAAAPHLAGRHTLNQLVLGEVGVQKQVPAARHEGRTGGGEG